MQLPEADYSRGMSSLGREGQGAIASLESQASSKLQEGALYPKWASAKAAIAHDVVQFAAEVKSWEEARQEAKAVAAFSKYSTQVAAAESEVSNARAYRPADIPESVKVNRFRKAEDGTDVERETIDQWEVAPGMFDHHEKGFRESALSEISEGKAKIALSRKIEERRSQGQIKMKTIHYKGQLEVMQNDLITAATKHANTGNTKEAVQSIEVGIRNGTFTLDEGRKLTKDILEAGDETRARRELLATNDPAKLETMQRNLLATVDKGAENPYPNLSPLKRLSIAQTIDTKRIELEKAGMTLERQKRTMNADEILKQADMDARNGKPWSQEQIRRASANMTDTEYRNLQSTVDAGAKVETTAAGAEGTRQILAALTSNKLPVKDDRTLSREEAAEYYRERNDHLYQTKQISLAERNSNNSQIDGWAKKTYDSPDFNDAEKYINTVIGKPDKRQAKHSNAFELAQQDFVNEMRRIANSSQGKFNAMAWAQENASRFIKQRDDEVYRNLVRYGAQAYVKFNKDRSIDRVATQTALNAARKAKSLNGDKFIDAMNAVNSIPVVETE
jgi:hypothetical protein